MERSSQIENIAATVIIAFMALGSFYIVRPFLPAVLWAIIFAVSCWPLFTRIEKKLDGRRGVAAGIVILLFVSLVLFPLCFAVIKLAEATPRAMEAISAALQSGMPPLPDWVGRVPSVGDRLVEQWTRIGTEAPDMAALIGPYLKSLAPNALGPGSSVGRTLGLVLLSLVMLFCFLREGHAIVATLERMVVLLGGEKGVRLLHLAAVTMNSVVYGILGTAIVQGILATFGFWLAGVPGLLVLSSAVFVLAVVTLGLTGLVLFPVAGWLFYEGRTGWGIFMIVWALMVGSLDNYIRPAFISRGAHLPFIVVFVGILGGVATGGFLGLFIGATVLGVFYTLLREWSASEGPIASACDAAPQQDRKD